MKFDKQEEDGVMIIATADRVDSSSAPEMELYLAGLINETSDNIILDFSDLKYISSAGLRVVLSTAKKLKEQDRTLVLSGLAGPVKQVFQLSGFFTIFKIFDTAGLALESLRQAG